MPDLRVRLRQSARWAARLAHLLAVPDHLPHHRTGPAPVLLSCADVDRGGIAGGRRYSPLLEGIRRVLQDDLGHPCVHLTHPFAVLRRGQVAGAPFTVNHRVLSIRALGALARRLGRPGVAAAREARLYERVLGALAPRAVIAVQPPSALCVAAKRGGIPVIEALHGTNVSQQDAVFRAYMARPDENIADILLAFDDVSHATFSAWSAGRPIEVLRADDPWAHACRLQRTAARIDHTPGVRRVLITLQWGYDGEREALSGVVPDGVLHPALEQAFATLAPLGIEFLVRMHPIQVTSPGYRHHRRRIRALAERLPNVEWERASAEPLPLLLDAVDGHITLSSSAVGEAAAAGVPSLLLCPTLQPGGAHDGFFREVIESGSAQLGRLDTASIESWVKALPRRGEPPAYDTRERQAAQRRFYAELLERRRPRGATSTMPRTRAAAAQEGT